MVVAGILADDEPVELLDGELVVVPPQGPPHATATSELHDRLRAVYGDGYAVREAKPIVAGEASLPEPDLAVVRGSHRDFRERHPRGDEAVLVVEVARTSLAIDRSKAETYARASVETYWLLDLNSGRLEVYEQPQADGRYRVVRLLAADDEVELPEAAVRFRVRDLVP